jgi:hypothetical protein
VTTPAIVVVVTGATPVVVVVVGTRVVVVVGMVVVGCKQTSSRIFLSVSSQSLGSVVVVVAPIVVVVVPTVVLVEGSTVVVVGGAVVVGVLDSTKTISSYQTSASFHGTPSVTGRCTSCTRAVIPEGAVTSR